MDFSRSHAGTDTVNEVVCWKWCKMESLILQTTNSKSYMAYQTAAIQMTLSGIQSHSPTTSLAFQM